MMTRTLALSLAVIALAAGGIVPPPEPGAPDPGAAPEATGADGAEEETREPEAGGAALPREVELQPGAQVRVEVWRGALELRRRRGGRLRLEVQRERAEDVACQSVSLEEAAGGEIAIRSAPSGPGTCTERVRLRLGLPEGARLSAVVSDGPVVADSVAGDLELAALGGPVRVSGGSGRLRVESNAGDIRVEDSAAEMILHSVGGRIEVAGEARAALRARSVSGAIALRLRRLETVQVSAETLGGDILVLYPAGPRPSLEIEPGSGSLEADFVLPQARAQEAGGPLVRAVEDGRPLLRLRTWNGRIRLRAIGDGDQEPEEEREDTASEKN